MPLDRCRTLIIPIPRTQLNLKNRKILNNYRIQPIVKEDSIKIKKKNNSVTVPFRPKRLILTKKRDVKP